MPRKQGEMYGCQQRGLKQKYESEGNSHFVTFNHEKRWDRKKGFMKIEEEEPSVNRGISGLEH